MSNPLWKIRFSNYKPIDIRDIESYCIKRNVDNKSPVKEEEINEEIEELFKEMILIHQKGKVNLDDFHRQLYEDNSNINFLLLSQYKASAIVEKFKREHKFKKKEDIFNHIKKLDKKKLKEMIVKTLREKLFTVEFELEDRRTTVKWGAYKTKEEAEIVYNKVDVYFKKTFNHFYKNLDSQEIYSL
tara:strand:- start:12853 stop:13410 length:558 start_codon:yes stop_codon:yes gene_type:complete